MRYYCCRHRTTRRASSSPLAAVVLLMAGLDTSLAANSMARYCTSGSAVAGAGVFARYNVVQPSTAFALRPGHRKRPRQYESPFISFDRHMALPHHSVHRPIASTTTPLYAKPKSGSIVDSYQTVSVNCSSVGRDCFATRRRTVPSPT